MTKPPSSDSPSAAASCADDFDPQSKTFEAALVEVMAQVDAITEVETVSLLQGLNRTLANDVVATVNVPPHNNSAMDGYAVRLADVHANSYRLPIVATNLAGMPAVTLQPEGGCVRIMTGAVLPEGADAVVMQEQVSLDGQVAVFPPQITVNQNIRLAGEDVARDSLLVAKGALLNPAQLGVLAGQGIERVAVVRVPRVGVFVTGDELQAPGNALETGQIYDSNRITILSMLQKMGCAVVDLGRAVDSPEGLDVLLEQVKASDLDVLITTGGVSVGEADYVRDAVARAGKLGLWRVAMKPGRPFAAGSVPAANSAGSAYFFGLPGNPVSAMATFALLVKPALQKLMGQRVECPVEWQASTLTPLRKRPGRMDFQRAVFSGEAGARQVRAIADQGSGRLSSMAEANCFIVLNSNCSGVAAGDVVHVLPFNQLY